MSWLNSTWQLLASQKQGLLHVKSTSFLHSNGAYVSRLKVTQIGPQNYKNNITVNPWPRFNDGGKQYVKTYTVSQKSSHKVTASLKVGTFLRHSVGFEGGPKKSTTMEYSMNLVAIFNCAPGVVSTHFWEGPLPPLIALKISNLPSNFCPQIMVTYSQ